MACTARTCKYNKGFEPMTSWFVLAVRVQLGTSDLQVSPICVGCWQFNGNQADETWPAQPEHVGTIKDLNQ